MLIWMKQAGFSLRSLVIAGVLAGCVVASLGSSAGAAGAFPSQQSSGSVGLQGSITKGAPTRGATIATPGNGAVFSTIPITVTGSCPTGVLVKLFDNNVFVGSVFCAGGSYSIQISLFNGQNELVAKVVDALDQPGPDSNTVNVTFNDANFAEFGSTMTLSSVFGERGAPPGEELTWPLTLTGGIGPYAISVDWGDGTTPDLISQSNSGEFTIKHVYKTAGIYKIVIKVTDKNGSIAFIQLVAQATGATLGSATKGSGGDAYVRTVVLWWPALLMIPLILASFWAGRRSELFSIRKQLEKNQKAAKRP